MFYIYNGYHLLSSYNFLIHEPICPTCMGVGGFKVIKCSWTTFV